MYKVLYRAYRPEVFSEVLGQEHIVKILENQIKHGTVNHAYLFCGTRGTGKTTVARLLAKGVNCLSEGEKPCGECENCRAIKEGIFMDITEIDAASNNSVDNIRELRESVKYPPATGMKRVYIIDEVHMLSSSAFNALLKTLEEPPDHVIFILATTEPQKLPATILSRCMRMDFHRVSEKKIIEGMSDICRKEGIDITDDALGLIAVSADGSVRDGLTVLDQCTAGRQGKIIREDVLESLGTAGEETYIAMTEKVITRDPSGGMILINDVLSEGKDARQIAAGWLAHYRNLLIAKFVDDPADMLGMSAENAERVCEQSRRLDLSGINEAIIELSHTAAEIKWSAQPRILLELSMVRLSSGSHADGDPDPKRGGDAGTGRNPETVPKPKVPASDKKTIRNQAEKDRQSLWDEIAKEGEKLKGSFNIIRKGTALEAVDESEFTVSAGGGTKIFVERNTAVIEDLMEKHTGKRRKLRCILKEDDEKDDSQAGEVTAEQLETLLGTKVEMQ